MGASRVEQVEAREEETATCSDPPRELGRVRRKGVGESRRLGCVAEAIRDEEASDDAGTMPLPTLSFRNLNFPRSPSSDLSL